MPKAHKQTSIWRHRIEYLGFLIVRFLARHVPARFVDRLSAGIWLLIAPRLFRHRRALHNLKAALPALSASEREAIAMAMWDNLGRTTMESMALDQIADDTKAINLKFSDEVSAIMRDQRPAIFVGLHAGNWEVAAIAAEKFNKPLMGVYQKILNPLVDRSVTGLRERFYKGGLHTKGADTVTRIRRGLSQGYSVAIMSDLRDAHGEFVPFFGLRARSTIFPALLARLYHVPIIAIRAVRIGVRQFRIEAVVIEIDQGQDRKRALYETTLHIQQQFEAWIREAPELWMWGHNRWDLKP